MMPLSDIKPAKRNPKQHDLKEIKSSFGRFGFVEIPVMNERTGRVVAGHGRLEALIEMRDAGEEPPDRVLKRGKEFFVPVQRGVKFKNQKEAEAYLLASNRLVERGGWSEPDLAGMLRDIDLTVDGALDGIGFTERHVRSLINEHFPDEPPEQDEVPELPKDPVTKVGDLWKLGDHRLLCGDSTDSTVLARVMGGKHADLVTMDPPYGLDYVGKTKDALPVHNDDPDTLAALLNSSFALVLEHTREGGVWYVFAPPGDLFLEFARILAALKVWRQSLVWVKDQFVMGRSDFHYRHEAIFYGWKPGSAHRPPPDRKQDTVWEFDRPKASEDHPTMKPLPLISKTVRLSSERGELVMDPFSGSGTTLIASEQQERVARCVEFSPAYCDVIVERWQQLTGGKATR